jgi:hypothetical protein
MHPAAEVWRGALERLDRWFSDARERLPGVIPCGPGCSACCHGPFDISVADALLLQEGLVELPNAEREEVRERGRALLTRMREQAPNWQPPWDIAQLGEDRFDAITDRLSGEPCPLLDAEGRRRGSGPEWDRHSPARFHRPSSSAGRSSGRRAAGGHRPGNALPC